MSDETKTPDTREGASVEGPFESAFDALFEPEEAANLKVRAALMRRLERYVEDEGLAQQEAARRFDTGQPRVSDLMAGRIHNFTVDALLCMCAAAGIKVEVTFPGASAKA